MLTLAWVALVLIFTAALAAYLKSDTGDRDMTATATHAMAGATAPATPRTTTTDEPWPSYTIPFMGGPAASGETNGDTAASTAADIPHPVVAEAVTDLGDPDGGDNPDDAIPDAHASHASPATSPPASHASPASPAASPASIWRRHDLVDFDNGRRRITRVKLVAMYERRPGVWKTDMAGVDLHEAYFRRAD